jgi:uncharacterized membrane protein (DUF2068 family)
VAIFEASKGILALLAGTGLLSISHGGSQAAILRLIQNLDMDPGQEYPRMFLAAATDSNVLLLASGGLAYASVRFTEAYGLWFGRRWAEWFAALSGAIYIPFELYELVRNPGWVALSVLGINLLIVGYMSLILYRSKKAERMLARLSAAVP